MPNSSTESSAERPGTGADNVFSTGESSRDGMTDGFGEDATSKEVVCDLLVSSGRGDVGVDWRLDGGESVASGARGCDATCWVLGGGGGVTRSASSSTGSLRDSVSSGRSARARQSASPKSSQPRLSA